MDRASGAEMDAILSGALSQYDGAYTSYTAVYSNSSEFSATTVQSIFECKP